MTSSSRSLLLFIGDALAILMVTLAGFASHQQSVFTTRWLATFLPVCAAWALFAPWLGLYRADVVSQPLQAWRAGWAMLLAAPLAGLLRAVWLNTTVIPVFVLVLGLTSALGMALWRCAYAWLTTKTGLYGRS